MIVSGFRFRAEQRIAKAICDNFTLLKVGLRFEFSEVRDKVQHHLMSNIDRLRKERVKKDGAASSKVEWNSIKTIDAPMAKGSEEAAETAAPQEE